MASGRVSMRFTSDISQANASIAKLNAQLRNQQKEVQKLKDRSKEGTKTQNDMFVNLTRNLSAAALGYQAVNKAISFGNELLMKRNELQAATLPPKIQAGEAMARLHLQIADWPTDVADTLLTELKKIGVDKKVKPTTLFNLAGAIATSTALAPGMDDPRKHMQMVLEMTRESAEVSRAYPRGTIGMIAGSLVTEAGFAPKEAIAKVLAFQKQLYALDPQQQQHAIGAMKAHQLFSMEGFKDLPDARKQQLVMESMAVTAGFSHFLKKQGLEMPSSASGGLALTLYKKFGPMLQGKSIFEAMDWMFESGAYQTLEMKDFFGEAMAKPGAMQALQRGEMFDMMKQAYQEIKRFGPAESEKVIARASGRGDLYQKHPEVRLWAEEEQRQAEAMVELMDTAVAQSIETDRQKFGDMFQTAGEMAAKHTGQQVQRFFGTTTDPRKQLYRLLNDARSLAYQRRYPLIGQVMQAGTGGMAAMLDFGTEAAAMREYVTTGEFGRFSREFSREELDKLERDVNEILDAAGVDRAKIWPKTINPNEGQQEQSRALKASVEQAGGSKAVGRQTEPD